MMWSEISRQEWREGGIMNKLTILGLLSMFLVILSGCAGTQSFSGAVRAGDTVAVAVGLRQGLAKDNVTVTITTGPPANQVIHAIYPPNSPAIRAVLNLYPDPLSSLLVSPQVGEDLTPYAQLYAEMMDTNYAGHDKDWSQTVIFVDLPPTLPVGMARISVSGGGYANPPPSVVEILPGAGSPIGFITEGGTLTDAQLQSLGRVQSQSVTFSGGSVPYAIQIDFAHNPDRDNGGTGKAHVVNTRGDIKSVAWRDDGTRLRVILTPAQSRMLSDLHDFKFYIAGGLTGLYVTDVRAYDANGNTVTGISAALSGAL